MNSNWILFCGVMLAACPLMARENTDVIIMKNGDHITCEIKALQSNTLHISVPYIIGTLSLDWSKVEHVESKQLFLVRTQNGLVFTGTLSTPQTSTDRPLQIEIVEAPETRATLERSQVVNMNETSNSFWQRWNGRIGTGFTYSKGNNSAQYNLNSDINYPRERWSAEATYDSNLTSNTGAETSTRNQVSFSAQHLMRWNNWYYTGITDFLQSSVQGIQLQSTFGGGIGRILKNTGGTSLKLYGGLGWQRISYQETTLPTHRELVTSGLFGANLRLFRFDRTTLTTSANFLPAISDSGRMHFNLNSSYYVKLWGKLEWNFTFYGNWDTRPPPGFSTADYGTSSGLSLSFGNH